MSSITINNVTKFFDSVEVIRDFSLGINNKEFVTLLGPSGCGKTTMLRMIAGFERPTSGEIFIDDTLVSSAKNFVPPEERGIGMVFQSYAVWPHMTVAENVAYPLKIAKRPKAEIKSRVEKILESVHLEQYAARIPSQLSGGQQQRVALGRALISEPRLLLLDEPLSNLDAKLRESMRFEILDIQKKFSITVVYVTHDQTEAMAMSSRIILMNDGKIEQAAPPAEIYRRPATTFAADFIGKVNFLAGSARSGSITLSASAQVLPYCGPLTGAVTVAIRPENIFFPSPGGGTATGGAMEKGMSSLEGTVLSMFYLGDVYDFRVDINGEVLRVISGSGSADTVREGDRVALFVKEFIVFSGGQALQTSRPSP